MYHNMIIVALAAFFTLTNIGATAIPVVQLAGVGAAADAIFTDTDNGVGYGIENAEDNVAGNIATVKGAVPATPAPAPAPAMSRRQLNKIANGAGAIGNAAGVAPLSDPAVAEADAIDDQSTNDIATVGQQIGTDEETTLEQAGSDVP